MLFCFALKFQSILMLSEFHSRNLCRRKCIKQHSQTKTQSKCRLWGQAHWTIPSHNDFYQQRNSVKILQQTEEQKAKDMKKQNYRTFHPFLYIKRVNEKKDCLASNINAIWFVSLCVFIHFDSLMAFLLCYCQLKLM